MSFKFVPPTLRRAAPGQVCNKKREGQRGEYNKRASKNVSTSSWVQQPTTHTYREKTKAELAHLPELREKLSTSYQVIASESSSPWIQLSSMPLLLTGVLLASLHTSVYPDVIRNTVEAHPVRGRRHVCHVSPIIM